MVNKLKILIPQDIDDEGKNYLKNIGYDVSVGSGFDAETIKREIVDADALIARTAPYPADVIAAGRRLKIIARHGVGADNVDIKFAEDHGIWVTITKNVNMSSVAEHVMLFLLACARRLVWEDKGVKGGNWTGVRFGATSTELRGKTLGVIGLGAIGRVVCEKAHFGLEMKILGCDAYTDAATLPDYVEVTDSMDEIFKRSDAITLHVPLNTETKYLVNERSLRLMKKSAFLVNCARGGTVDEEALYEALISGEIKSAAMDVFISEPINMDNKLIGLDNFICTPHDAAMTDKALVDMALSAARACDDVLSGREPEYPINNPVR